jgi:hypothetical protein
MKRLIGMEQFKQRYTGNSFLGAGKRPGLAILKLPVLLSCVYQFFTFASTIGNNVTISVFLVPVYNFDFRNLAAIYVAPVSIYLPYGHVSGSRFTIISPTGIP